MDFFEGLLSAAVRISIPILFVVLGEIVAERAGVLNLGLEGMMLAGAFGGFAGAAASGSLGLGLAAGTIFALAFAALFAFLVVRRDCDPIVVGVALNLLAAGVTGVLHRAMTDGGALPARVEPFAVWSIPGLSGLPLVGPALFSQNVFAYVAFAATALLGWFLTRTSAGLVLRSSGENPEAARTAGIDVRRLRTLATLFGGALAGIGGVYLSIGYSDTFVENMSAGRGFVALAIVVFARWNPIAGLGGSLLFGLAMSLQARLQGERVFGMEIPYHFFQMLPYALTLVVLAMAGRSGMRAPAALGKPLGRGRA